jgi:putative tricarboxylic transport membrane protein
MPVNIEESVLSRGGEPMSRKMNFLPGLCGAALSAFAMLCAYRYELGSFQDPGPGLMPFLAGSALLVVSCILVLSSFSAGKAHGESPVIQTESGRCKAGLVLGSLLVYAFVLETAGYPVATSLLLILLFRVAGARKWRNFVPAAVLTAILTFFVFTHLGLRFPIGIWKGY